MLLSRTIHCTFHRLLSMFCFLHCVLYISNVFIVAYQQRIRRHTGIPELWTQELSAGLSTLDSGRWTLGAGLWTLYAGCSPLNNGLWTLDTVVDCFRIESESSF